MHLPTLLFIQVLAAVPVLSAAVSKRHVLHERSLPDVHGKWHRGERVHKDAIIPLRIGLTQSQLELGDEHLMAVSDPRSPLYGQHWTAEQVHSFFAPAEQAVAEVKAWLSEHGINADEILNYENKGWLGLDIPTHKIEELFHTTYYEHEYEDDGSIRIGCSEYHIPAHIQHHIDYITPGVKLSPPLKKRSVNRAATHFNDRGPLRGPALDATSSHASRLPSNALSLPPELQYCATNITPPCLRALYGIPQAYLNDDVNALGIYEDGNYWTRIDLDLFFANYAPQVPQGTAPLVDSIDGGTSPHHLACYNGLCGEAVLDIDIAYSMIYPQSVVVYQVDDKHYSVLESEEKILGFLNTFLDALDGSYCNYTAFGITGNSPGLDPAYPDPAPNGYKGSLQCGVYQPTRVISASYGQAEADLPPNYTRRQCNEFMKLGLQGHSIFFSSGDYGVSSFRNDPKGAKNGCLSGFGQRETIFTPNYPVNCPYLTAVGATQLNSNETIYDPESALQFPLPGAGRFASAGGFSNYFTQPSYQEAAVSTYFANYDPGYPYYTANYEATNIGVDGGRYNRAGRGYPDVSANGANLNVYTNKTLYQYYGTSLAAPLWASITTLINEERTVAGKGPVGFINPVLYQNPQAMTDITNGSNPGCHSAGFHAVPGWDPITGLGTPKYPDLLALFMSLP